MNISHNSTVVKLKDTKSVTIILTKEEAQELLTDLLDNSYLSNTGKAVRKYLANLPFIE